MGDLFSQLGIDWKLLIAQIVNFTILAAVLTKFLYKPILKTLEERRERTADDLAKSEELTAKLRETDKTKDEILSAARRESEKLIKDTEKNAASIKESLMKEAGIESDKIRVDAKKQIESDREKTMQELKKELGHLVVATVEKAMGDVTDKSTQTKMVDEALKKS